MRADGTLMVRGRWRCESKIATLATNTVWRAHDQLLDRPVAIRIFHTEQLQDPVTRRRLQKTFAVAARLQHDNVACVFDAFDDELGVVLVSELVEGPTLREVVDHLAPLPDEAVAAIGVQLAHGASAAATVGLTHRELTPKHVRITYDGTVKILGLGSTRPLADEGATPMAGQATDATYLAPEQTAGGRSDHRTDIYSLGLMLWELAVGAPPFEDELEGGMKEDVPAPRRESGAIAAQVSEAIEEATRLDPDARWGDAQQLGTSLLQVCTTRPKRIVYDLVGSLLPAQPTPIATLRAPTAAAAGTGPENRDAETGTPGTQS
jgi:serine/threonine protein kinase, bacterial